MSAPLPVFWSENIDDKGRTYYCNHHTRETTWQRPAARAAVEGPELPPPYGSNLYASRNAHAPRQPAPSVTPSGPCCSPRLTFWLACALGWIVWAFAVAVTADDGWIKGWSFKLSALDEELLDSCDESTAVCDLYKAFSAMQTIAVVCVSVAMILQMIALFRPASGQCCSVKALALAGGSLMIAYAFFQMLAFVLVIAIEKELDGALFSYTDAKVGVTFGVAVVACMLGMVQATSVLVFARSAGNGPAYSCCYECMDLNQDRNHTVCGDGGANYQQPQPPLQQQAPPTAVFEMGPPQTVQAGVGKPLEP